jgi:hypothetical protein
MSVDEIFSCRNCIHNCGQGLTIGRAAGFCLQHDSVIEEPDRTTCKYLHRKDLPYFVVDEGVREHAAEFATYPRLVTLDTREPIERIQYSERFLWEQRTFDPVVHTVAQYYKVKPRWVLISGFAGGVDGRRALTHGSLVRHYMYQCDNWTSSYRLVLALLQDIDVQPQFAESELLLKDSMSKKEANDEALWEVVFVRLSALQEYGWHSGLERLMWASDDLNGNLADLNWTGLKKEFSRLREPWIEMIINHAKEHHAFFPPLEQNPEDLYNPEG